jgi:hypothetical protein
MVLILAEMSSLGAASIARADSDFAALIMKIKAVGREGAGNAEASKAWKELVRAGPKSLLIVLAAFDDADTTADNWLRLAVDTIAERALASGGFLPAKELEAFILETQHHPAARRLAYEWLARVDSTAPDRLLPGMLDDRSVELRRDAVAMVVKEAKMQLGKKNNTAAISAYRRALSGARDKDQVDLIARELKALDSEVDLAAHFGFVRKWMLIGPFDNSKESGFQKAYPPETRVDLSDAYDGKRGARVRWKDHSTSDPYGLVDLNKALGKNMGAVAYAFAAIDSPAEQAIQIRAASNNAVKIFLNGKEIFFREEYHHGMEMDQHAGTGVLHRGRNQVLLKVCQNDQTEDWAQSWSFQLRICDAVGGAVSFTICPGTTTSSPAQGKAK